MPLRNWKVLIIPIGIIIFPIVFWLLISSGHNHFKRLPILGPADVNEHGDTVYHVVGPFRFTNQEGKIITDKNLEGKIFVANFFFATCKTVCPKMNEQVYRVQQKFKEDDNVRFLSFTVDPLHDSVPVLSEYARKMGGSDKQWWFLTGNKDSIYTLAREGFLVPAAEGKTANDFFHSQDLMLIDRQKHIRGVFDGAEPAQVDTLIDQIKVLEQEYREK
jgi:protein SCO1/2